MAGTPNPITVSTKLQGIATLASEAPDDAFWKQAMPMRGGWVIKTDLPPLPIHHLI